MSNCAYRLRITILVLLSSTVCTCSSALSQLHRANSSNGFSHLTIAGAVPQSLTDAEDAATDNEAIEKYAARIRNLLNQNQFDQLDKTADAVRKDKSRFAGGAWKLHKLYLGMKEPADFRRASEAEWQLHLGKLKSWVAQHPASITARVGLAHAYVEYGWKARGRGYVDTVSDEGWMLLRERLALAESVLHEAQKLTAKCPHWYAVMQVVALGQSWEMERADRLFEQAIAAEPTYHYFYDNKAVSLLPRWNGEVGDWEQFADQISARFGGKQGSILYYIIATNLAYNYTGRTLFTETKVSWPRIKQGFADSEQTYGASISEINNLCRIAGQAGDRPLAQQLLTRIGDNWDPEIWKNKAYFEHYKAWAFDRR